MELSEYHRVCAMSGFSRKFLILSAVSCGVSFIDDSSYLVGIGFFVSGMVFFLLKSMIDAIFRSKPETVEAYAVPQTPAGSVYLENQQSRQGRRDPSDDDFLSLQERSTNKEFFVDIDDDYTQAITD